MNSDSSLRDPSRGNFSGALLPFPLFSFKSRARAQVRSDGAILGVLAICRHFGAEIIKVEPPRSGDPLRVWRELDVDGTSPWFRSLARNKKSVSIDMRKEEGRTCVFNFHSNHFLLTVLIYVAMNNFVIIDSYDGLRSVQMS